MVRGLDVVPSSRATDDVLDALRMGAWDVTDWEVGQDLCHLSDEIRSHMKDLRESHPEVYSMLDDISRTIGDMFNREPFQTSHKFGLISHADREMETQLDRLEDEKYSEHLNNGRIE